MQSDDRPDPDQLLRALSRNDTERPTGNLHVFFGMAAGVGKTYAMLEAARARAADGTDVVVGLVETHGRAETERLLQGLTVIPRRKTTYRDVELAEMDIDAILARRPQLALVDELAHTNVPGSRHPKRWQDVVELLDAGIDVFTTLNVQHVESRKDSVQTIAGITIRECVPDQLLERAAQIELVDITPGDLLKRLREGKVYLGDKADTAAANFFKEDRLTALRELSLRLTAELVDNALHDMMLTQSGSARWKPTERLMVAVSHSPFSEGLIRATRRIAFSLSAPWIAVNVNTGAILSDADRATLARNLRLVTELGGELVSTSDSDISLALRRVADQRRVTQLVIGRPTWRWRDLLSGGSILDRLARQEAPYDILVLQPNSQEITPGQTRSNPPVKSFRPGPYYIAVGTVIAVALINGLLFGVIGYKAVGFVFLLSVLLLSLVVPVGAVTTGALLSALIWDYFFIPPRGTMHISSPEDVMMVVSYIVAALVPGSLTYRLRTRERLIREREARTGLLYDLAKNLVAQPNMASALESLSQRLGTLLQGEIDLLVVDQSGRLKSSSVLGNDWLATEKERAVAVWAFEHGRAAGWATDTLPMAAAMYLPLRGTSGPSMGVMAFRPKTDRRLTQDEENLLSAIAHQLVLSVERDRLQEAAQQAERLRDSERLLQAVIDSISHELRTPLTAIAGNVSALASMDVTADPKGREAIVSDLLSIVDRLNRVVGNLLDMSRFSASAVALQADWHDIGDLIVSSVRATERQTSHHTIQMRIAENLPLAWVDYRLVQQAIENLIANAANYSPADSLVEISCEAFENRFLISVCDRGPGIPEAALPHLFEKFYRVPGTPSGGVGLGLAIAKAIVEVHGGSIGARNRPNGGAVFSISLPVRTQPDIPGEA